MTWATIEEAWGNYEEIKENYQNYYENFQNYEQPEERKLKPKNNSKKNNSKKNNSKKNNSKKDNSKKDIIDINEQIQNEEDVYNIGNDSGNDLDNDVDIRIPENDINKQYVDIEKIEQMVSEKIAKLNSNTEKQIYKLNLEVKKLLSAVNNINSETSNNNSMKNVFNKNIHDILLFIIFGIFIILLLDATYRILLVKIKKI